MRGFTLIELLVVMSIMIVITAVFLVRNSQFNSAILLRSLAYEVALSIREAQVYGVGVREVSAGSNNFTAGYGVYFSSDAPTDYVLFADLDKNGLYGAGDTIMQSFAVRNGFTVARICAVTTTGVSQCSPADITSLVVSFKRPNPEALIKTNVAGYSYASASITVSSPNGSTRTVTIGTAGEIEVQQVGN